MAEKEDVLKTGYLTTHTGPDETVVEGDDLLEEIKDTIGNYLSKKTKEKNVFTVSPGSVDSSITTPDGLPAPIVSDGAGSDNPYASDAKLSNSGIETLGMYSNSGKFETLSDLVKKGKQAGQGKDGNRLLIELPANGLNRDGATIIAGGDDSPVTKQVSNILKRANRFDPSNTTPFISVAGTQIASTQQELGRFDRGANVPSITDLQKVGLSLMLRATGEFVDGDPDAIGETATLIPGAAQLAATRIDARGMYAKNAFGAPQGKVEVNTEIAGQAEGMFGDVSYGNLNSAYEPFGGFLPVGMTILGTALIIALKIVLEVFGFLFEMILSTSNTTKALPLPLGKNIASTDSGGFLSSFMSPSTLGIRETKFPFASSFARGTDAFFSFDGASFNRILTAPGYYAITVRAIIRSGNTIANSIVEVGGSPTDVAQGIMGLVDVIKSSKIIGLINVLTGIGDNVLMLEESGFAEDETIISTIDRVNGEKNPAAHVFKSRMKTGHLGLAWANNTSKSKYIMPENVIKADFVFGNNRRKMLGVASAIDAELVSRLEPDDVASIERVLDAEYVPFYFHDLRTNEIISFHAFIDSLNDAYTANYEASAGYGRIDPVRIYKNTERTLTVSFYAVATNENDFDHMWVKINKLMTMLYPQWSSGRAIAKEKTRFTQPFSQTISASPMIRLRIGDVIKSNYSRFGLARLFGLGDDDFSLTGVKAFSQFDVDGLKEKITKAYKDLESSDDATKGYPNGMKVRLQPGIFRKGRPSGLLGGAASMIGIGGSDKAPSEYSTSGEVVVIQRKETEAYQRTIGMGGTGEVATRLVYDVKIDKYPDVTYVASWNYLKPINSEVLNQLEISSGEGYLIDSTEAAAIKSFFEGETSDGTTNNSIVKSFKTTQGKGLAGFITNISFDWISNVTWDTGRFGSRAPKAFKIDFGFAPTHDIAPGLDADGFNRAPVYNVGSIINDISGDVYDEEGKSEINFDRLHQNIEPKKGG